MTSLDIGSDGEAETRWSFDRTYHFSRKITLFFKYKMGHLGGQGEVSQQKVQTLNLRNKN